MKKRHSGRIDCVRPVPDPATTHPKPTSGPPKVQNTTVRTRCRLFHQSRKDWSAGRAEGELSIPCPPTLVPRNSSSPARADFPEKPKFDPTPGRKKRRRRGRAAGAAAPALPLSFPAEVRRSVDNGWWERRVIFLSLGRSIVEAAIAGGSIVVLGGVCLDNGQGDLPHQPDEDRSDGRLLGQLGRLVGPLFFAGRMALLAGREKGMERSRRDKGGRRWRESVKRSFAC